MRAGSLVRKRGRGGGGFEGCSCCCCCWELLGEAEEGEGGCGEVEDAAGGGGGVAMVAGWNWEGRDGYVILVSTVDQIRYDSGVF